VNFSGQADEHIRHGVADLLRIADHHALAIAQHDVPRNSYDGGVVGNAAQHNRTCAHAAVVPHRDVAEDLRTRADDHVVADGRVSLTLFLTGTAERDSLVQHHAIAHDRSLSDHHSHAVIDE